MAGPWFDLAFTVLAGAWVLNWLGVAVLTGALGLRRRRWGTPGGGRAMAAAALALAAPAAFGLCVLAVWLFNLSPRHVLPYGLPAAGGVVLGLVFLSHACLVGAVYDAREAVAAAEGWGYPTGEGFDGRAPGAGDAFDGEPR